MIHDSEICRLHSNFYYDSHDDFHYDFQYDFNDDFHDDVDDDNFMKMF